MSPFNLTISFTNREDIIWFSTSDIKKIVSILLLSFLFIPANWNSYSKSETALNPLKIIVALYFVQSEVVNVLKDKTLIDLDLNFKSLNIAFLINETLSSALNKHFFL